MRRPHLLAVLLLSVMLLSGCETDGTSPTAAPSSAAASASTHTVDRPLSLLVIGDSYAVGIGADRGDTSFARQLGRDLGAITSVDAVSGTGYANPGGNGLDQRYGARLPALSADQLASTVVVVEGGLNDRFYPGADVRAAAQDFLAQLVDLAPTSTVVLVGATAPVPTEPAASVAVNAQLAQAAAQYDIAFVDPVGPEWFTAENVGDYVLTDQLHPTQAGHDFLARRIADIIGPLLDD